LKLDISPEKSGKIPNLKKITMIQIQIFKRFDPKIFGIPRITEFWTFMEINSRSPTRCGGIAGSNHSY
jgi:hypothetical protein